MIETCNRKSGKEQTLYHLQVQDAWWGEYWLHLEMNGGATLKQLDDYLRAIWLECCGHLSRFSLGGWGSEEFEMTMRVDRLFAPDLALTHIYDFGTSSETLIRVVSERVGRATTSYPIALMARNKEPEVSCVACEEKARWLCIECMYEHDEPGLLCEAHAERHPHEDYGGPLPIVNSPRVGMCGYEGPADPPY